jgi:hypothetical protein
MPIEKFSDKDEKRIKLKVLEKVMDKKKVVYHLSYDVIECEKNFGTYQNAKEYLLCVLANTNFESIESYNYSTVFVHYITPNHNKLLKYLEKHLTSYFKFSISLVAKNTESNEDIIIHHGHKKLNENLQDIIDSLSCDRFNKIEQY